MRFIHKLISCLDFRAAGTAACVPAGAAEALPRESVWAGQPGHILAPLGFLLHSNRQDAAADDAAAGVPKTPRYRDDRFERPPAPATGTFAFTPRDLRVLLIVILAIAAFLRFYALPSTPPGLFRDEGADGADALVAAETHHFDAFYPDDNGREGLYVNVAAVCIELFGHEAWVLRLPAAIFGFLTVLGIYLLTAELLPVPTALLAAFFLATSFWHINFSRIAFRAIAAPFFLAWSLYLILVAFRRLRERKTYLDWFAAAGIVYSFGFYTYIAYRATPAVVGLVLLHYFFLARREDWLAGFWKATAVFAIVTALVAAPLTVYFMRHPGTFNGRAAQVSVFTLPHPVQEIGINLGKTVMMFYTSGDANWRHNYSGRPEVYWPVAVFMTLGFLIAIGRLISGGKDEGRLPYLIALSWLFVGAMPAFLSDESVPHALRAILMVPAVFLLASIGARSLYSGLARIIHNGILPATATVVLLILTCEAGYTYFVRWAGTPELPAYFDIWNTQLANEINAYPRNLPKVVAIMARDIPFHQLPLTVATVMYLTKTCTPREQERANVSYYTPETFDRSIPPELRGHNFCEQVTETMPGVKVFCMP
jgi:4-amino-4-deoxy-L-arabinose transferase-like glycosyltransferase